MKKMKKMMVLSVCTALVGTMNAGAFCLPQNLPSACGATTCFTLRNVPISMLSQLAWTNSCNRMLFNVIQDLAVNGWQCPTANRACNAAGTCDLHAKPITYNLPQMPATCNAAPANKPVLKTPKTTADKKPAADQKTTPMAIPVWVYRYTTPAATPAPETRHTTPAATPAPETRHTAPAATPAPETRHTTPAATPAPATRHTAPAATPAPETRHTAPAATPAPETRHTTPAATPAPATRHTAPASSMTEESEVLRLVNEARTQNGLSPLTMDTTLCAAARTRAVEIQSVFDHTRPNGTSFSSAITQAGASFNWAGENIAYGQRNAASVMDSWMHSPGHRKNILSSHFGRIGIAAVNNGGTMYWVQLFTN